MKKLLLILSFILVSVDANSSKPLAIQPRSSQNYISKRQRVTFLGSVSDKCKVGSCSFKNNSNKTVTVTCACRNYNGLHVPKSVTFTPKKVNQLNYGYASDNKESLYVAFQKN